MAHKTICHVLTHWATETSSTSCLAARDNILPVPADGCAAVAVSLCVCAVIKWLNSFTPSPWPLYVLLHTKKVIWRHCFDPFLHWGRNSPRACSALQLWIQRDTPAVSKRVREPVSPTRYSEDKFPAANKVHQIRVLHGHDRQKKLSALPGLSVCFGMWGCSSKISIFSVKVSLKWAFLFSLSII